MTKVRFYFSAFVFSYGPLEDVDAEAKKTVFQFFLVLAMKFFCLEENLFKEVLGTLFLWRVTRAVNSMVQVNTHGDVDVAKLRRDIE
ncbi:MAG: hypothetical protein JSV12_01635 [Candidatus Bathyarchaeota archaeon]|nr:MAG: hypothetical protein JSV12_01635 [Candidatus Bathyarchaeota archaeon]